jgi:diketogulonate reductase-like aldo/keto reductase
VYIHVFLQVGSMATTALSGRLSLSAPHIPHIAQAIPAFLYGTAWKKDATADLVYQAIKAGFTGIDTANQPKHYQEDLVGSGIRKALREGKMKRNNLYLQTKFTSTGGQDLNSIPYDPKGPPEKQVQESVKLSLQHLRSAGDNFEDVEGSYIDTLVLHSPMANIVQTMEVWEALEQFVPDKIRNLGISNCNLWTFMDLYERAYVKPCVVQNRFYPETRYDIALRRFCRDNSIVYQSFWTLTANPDLLRSSAVGQLANRLGISPQAALYCLVMGLGNTVVLNGTKQDARMRADLEAVEQVRNFSEQRPDDWKHILEAFKKLIRDSVT